MDSTNVAGVDPETQLPPKTKIAERLATVVDGASAEKNKNRSPELIPLAEDYEIMKKNLRRLIAFVKAYAETTERSVRCASNRIIVQF